MQLTFVSKISVVSHLSMYGRPFNYFGINCARPNGGHYSLYRDSFSFPVEIIMKTSITGIVSLAKS